MSLLSLNENYSSPLKPDEKNDIIFELPSLSSMNINDQTEGFTKYISTHGNSKLNEAVDNKTKEKTKLQIYFDGMIYEDLYCGIENLLNTEDKASDTEIAETIFAIKLLDKINLEIKQTEEEIAKYSAIKENLTKAINEHMS